MKSKSNFIPFYDKIEIQLLEKEGFFKSEQNLEERGVVTAIGKDVKFVKVGDTVYFSSWGLCQTTEVEGIKHWIIPETSEFILGKETNVAKVKV